jgi:hypothetical protein
MRKQPVVADQVFQFDAMDKTLKDYIDRANKRLEEEKKKPLTPNPNQYPVIPEKQNEDSDEKINPYGQH